MLTKTARHSLCATGWNCEHLHVKKRPASRDANEGLLEAGALPSGERLRIDGAGRAKRFTITKLGKSNDFVDR
jgi:hypothetical protein